MWALYYVKVNAPDLTATNELAEFPKVRLKVSDAREIYNAEFAPQNEAMTKVRTERKTFRFSQMY